MKITKIILSFIASAMLFASCETLSNLLGGNFFNSNLQSESGEQKVTPISKSATKKNSAIQDTENWDIASLDTARNVDYLSEIEKDVILEMNKARSDPKKYAELYIAPFAKKFRSDGTYIKDGVTMMTNEGVAVVNECIKEMSAKKAMEILRPEKGLSLAAQSHATSQAKTSQTGHKGTDGSSPFTRIQKYGTFRTAGENISYGSKDGQEIVIQLLVDDGVKNRGHRKNIFNSAFTQTGVGYAEGHKTYRAECVITYAGGYEEKK
uniref:SCP domain-containing protein n=1 Tax=uncultured Spirochaetaceae bacterium TaxID=201186 RepID=A0A650ENJ6_9SPIO|nr:hypothetical protein Unknown280_0510 [uncultured Spirochaetaceae bacterium]